MRFAEPDRHQPNAIRVISQPHLLEMLVAEAAKHPSFRFESSFNFQDVLRDSEGSVIGIVGETPRGREEIAARFIIGADGRGSLVRKKLGLDIDRFEENSPKNRDAVWWSFPLPEWLDTETVFYGFVGDDESLATMYPSATESLRFGWLIPKKSYQTLRQNDLLEQAARLAPQRIREFLLDHRDEASEPAYFNVLFGRCPSWSAPGILLLGDAAHPMNPNRAQGINLGLRDAVVAANHLLPVLEGDFAEAVDGAALRVQEEREPEIAIAQRLQLARFGPPPLFRKRWFRKTALRVLLSLGIPQRVVQQSDREAALRRLRSEARRLTLPCADKSIYADGASGWEDGARPIGPVGGRTPCLSELARR